jgi:hypothetical protein
MAPLTPRLVVPIDVKKQPWEQKVPLHNRWHPDIPPVADVTEGELFRVEMVDWTGGRVRDDNSADDIKSLDLTIVSLYPAAAAAVGDVFDLHSTLQLSFIAIASQTDYRYSTDSLS